MLDLRDFWDKLFYFLGSSTNRNIESRWSWSILPLKHLEFQSMCPKWILQWGFGLSNITQALHGLNRNAASHPKWDAATCSVRSWDPWDPETSKYYLCWTYSFERTVAIKYLFSYYVSIVVFKQISAGTKRHWVSQRNPSDIHHTSICLLVCCLQHILTLPSAVSCCCCRNQDSLKQIFVRSASTSRFS